MQGEQTKLLSTSFASTKGAEDFGVKFFRVLLYKKITRKTRFVLIKDTTLGVQILSKMSLTKINSMMKVVTMMKLNSRS